MASLSSPAGQGRRPTRSSTWSSYLTALVPTSWFASSSAVASSASTPSRSSPLGRIPRPILYLATFLGTSYFLTTYLISKLAALHGRMTREASSKETLKKRFQQNQDDVTFTVMALLPTLSAALSTGFDVEGVTASLRTVGAPATAPKATTLPSVSAEEAQTETGTDTAPPAQPPSALDAISEPRPQPISPDATLTAPVAEPAPATTVDGDALTSIEMEASSSPAKDDEDPQDVVQKGENAADAAEDASQSSATAEKAADAAGMPAMPVAHVGGADDGHPPVNGEAVPAALGTKEQPVPSLEGDNSGQVAEDTQETPSQQPPDAPSGEEQKAEALSGQEEPQELADGVTKQEQPAVNGEAHVEGSVPEASTEPQQAAEEEQSVDEPVAPQVPSPEEEEQRRQQLLLDRKRKAALWQDLKIVAISKALTTVYAVNLLSLLTHVQLNLLGRYAYLGSLADESSEAETAADQMLNSTRTSVDPFEDAWSRSVAAGGGQAAQKGPGTNGREKFALSQETEERYLTFSWYFLHRGWKELGLRVKEKVTECVESMPLKTQLTHAEMIAMLKRIRRRIEFEYEPCDSIGEEKEGSNAESQHHYNPQLRTDDPPDKMAFGAESLMPSGMNSRFGDADDMSASVMSTGSTVASTGTRQSRSRGFNAGRRKRFNLLQYLLPATAEGDLILLRESGLMPQGAHSHHADPREALQSYDSRLTLLLDETRDLLFDSPDVSRVLRRCLSASFDTTLFSNDGLRSAFGLPPISSLPPAAAPLQQSRLQELQSKQEEADFLGSSKGGGVGTRITLAALLPRLVRATDSALTSLPSECVDTVAGVEELRAFCAVVYSAWSGVG